MLLKDSGVETEIHLDFVPMADVLFNLLIFFLMATTIAQVEREMHIALPAASSSEPISAAVREITLNVDQAGQCHLGGRKVDLKEVSEIVKEAVERNGEQKVTVRGDRSTAYENVVRVLDVCKASGVSEPYLDTVVE